VCLRKRVFQSRLLLAFAPVVWKTIVQPKENRDSASSDVKRFLWELPVHSAAASLYSFAPLFRRSVLKNVRGEPRTFDLE
jgi:hypothetical protein